MATTTTTTPTAAAIDEMARRLVAQDVCYCVSALISTLADREWDGSDGIDPDELATLFSRQPDADDYRDAAGPGADFHVVVTMQDHDAGGRWHWAATGEDGEADEGRAASEVEAWRDAFAFVGADDPDGSEVYEHWLVTDDLARRLREQGETVADDIAGMTVWGRCTTGQAIYADSVMQRIARAILEA